VLNYLVPCRLGLRFSDLLPTHVSNLHICYKVDIKVTPGTHASESAVNKQLNDKERVAAALENAQLLEVVNKCIANTDM